MNNDGGANHKNNSPGKHDGSKRLNQKGRTMAREGNPIDLVWQAVTGQSCNRVGGMSRKAFKFKHMYIREVSKFESLKV